MDILTQKKIAVISGAFGYVGLEVAKELSAIGFSIAFLYNSTPVTEVNDIVKNFSEEEHKAYKCDLSNSQEVNLIINQIEEEQGTITVAVHAAGKKPVRKKLHLTTSEELESQLNNNVIGSFNFLTACAKKLKEHKNGLLIGITTVGVIVPEATKSLGAYIPAKFAVQGMLTMLKDELAPYNVRVHSIAPGFMPNGMNADIPKAFVEMIQTNTSTKELAKANDVAKLVVDLYQNFTKYNTLTIPIAPEYCI